MYHGTFNSQFETTNVSKLLRSNYDHYKPITCHFGLRTSAMDVSEFIFVLNAKLMVIIVKKVISVIIGIFNQNWLKIIIILSKIKIVCNYMYDSFE